MWEPCPPYAILRGELRAGWVHCGLITPHNSMRCHQAPAQGSGAGSLKHTQPHARGRVLTVPDSQRTWMHREGKRLAHGPVEAEMGFEAQWAHTERMRKCPGQSWRSRLPR